jgi:pimeloyl-ACP methyl ester carboxylesterase
MRHAALDKEVAAVGRLDVDGVQLFYEEAGSGDPPVLLVHGGAFCNHHYMTPIFDRLIQEHRVVSVDLRGHGESDRAPDGRYSNAAFADDLAAVCGRLELAQPIVIGHSSGGHAALELAARHPSIPRAVVLLDAGPLRWPDEALAMHEALVQMLRSDNGRAVLRTVAEQMMGANDDFPGRQRLLDEVTNASPEVFAALIESDLEWNGEAAAAACTVPVLHLVADKPLVSADDFRRACPHAMTGQTVGAGHFHQLIVPDQVNAMVQRFIAVLPDPSDAGPG